MSFISRWNNPFNYPLILTSWDIQVGWLVGEFVKMQKTCPPKIERLEAENQSEICSKENHLNQSFILTSYSVNFQGCNYAWQGA